MLSLCFDNEICYENIRLADSFSSRLLGLMFRKSTGEYSGLLLKNCGSIHCFFMRFPIDVIYLDKEYRVLFRETVFPWHIGRSVKGAAHVLELPQHSGDGIIAGMKCSLKEDD